MTVREFYEELNAMYPKELSCPWDNDGIMLSPNSDAEIRRAVVSLDASAGAVAYALGQGADLLLTHHPVIFRGIKSLTDVSAFGKKLIDAVSGGLTILSFHTRLDAGEGGVNDCLCRTLGFEPSGKFGDEEDPELGRTADVPVMSVSTLVQRVKNKLGCRAVRVYGDMQGAVRKIGVCGGDGKSFISAAMAAGCDAYITGDAGYNAAADAADEGLAVIEAGHFHTENPVCAALADFVREKCGAEVTVYGSCAYEII